MSYKILNPRPLGSGGNGDIYIGQRSDNGAIWRAEHWRNMRVFLPIASSGQSP